MHSGSCLCGTVKWQTGGELTPLSHCHCNMCRKAHGAPFATFTSCASDTFEWVSGADSIREYISSEQLVRRFCGRCGSSLPITSPNSDRTYLPAGNFDNDPEQGVWRHIFVASKPHWYEIADDIPQHEGWPTATDIPLDVEEIDMPLHDTAGTGIRRGSCLCGGVAFEVSAPFEVAFNCHCSRCRKARAAAHTTNGFVDAGAVSFTRGKDLVTLYRLPEAERFSQAFCSKCGSGLPRADATEGMISVPYGSLDDEPNIRPVSHIYTGSMALWYEIRDEIPQCDEGPE